MADWIRVWLQGGPVEDWDYFTLVEPPEVIHVLRNPFPGSSQKWIRVLGGWPEALTYRREPSVEQLDRERIYYPLADA
jgi:hypothetical protein